MTSKDKKVNFKLLKELRDKTLVSYALCKEALISNDNNLQAAIKWLKVKGISQAQSKFHRITKEGIIGVFHKEDYAILMQMKCETDFVAKNEIFQNFFWNLGNEIKKEKLANKNAILSWKWNKQSVEENILELSAKMGEKIHLEKLHVVNKNPKDKFFTYNHNNKISSLLIMSDNTDQKTGESIAMHVVAMKPKFVSLELIGEDFIAKEKEIIIKQMQNEKEENQGKSKIIPEKMKEKIIEGKLNKILKNQCLLEQKFVKNLNESVKNHIKEKNVRIINMFWLELD